MSNLFKYTVLSEEQLNFYHENGYLSLGKTLSDEGVKQLLDQSMAAWNAEKGAYSDNNSWLQNALLVDIHHKAPLVRDFYFNGPVMEASKQIIGPNIKGATSQLTFKMRGNTKPFGWHQDNGYGELDPFNSITSLTALEEVDEDNGCLRLISGSHKLGQIPLKDERDRSNLESIDMEVDESKAIPMPMKPGETLIFHCWTLHYSQGNFSKTRDRRILFMRYADADAVEVYNGGKPRLGRLLAGDTKFDEVRQFEAEL
ncbi:MAG: phytanoyl-CoA dioxygenase family protein [Cytophagales bacterium]|nr:phytanoyl-CoA dioxygenase family protein [Cytophagales bacterium]